MPLSRDEDLAKLIGSARTIAVVGLSDRPDRPSYGVARYMAERGWTVIGINPKLAGTELFGELVRARVSEIKEPVDIVDIFRRSEEAGTAVDEAIGAGARAVWLQLGVIDVAAAERAEAAGIPVVMDRCLKIDAARLGIVGPRRASTA